MVLVARLTGHPPRLEQSESMIRLMLCLAFGTVSTSPAILAPSGNCKTYPDDFCYEVRPCTAESLTNLTIATLASGQGPSQARTDVELCWTNVSFVLNTMMP